VYISTKEAVSGLYEITLRIIYNKCKLLYRTLFFLFYKKYVSLKVMYAGVFHYNDKFKT